MFLDVIAANFLLEKGRRGGCFSEGRAGGPAQTCCITLYPAPSRALMLTAGFKLPSEDGALGLGAGATWVVLVYSSGISTLEPLPAAGSLGQCRPLHPAGLAKRGGANSRGSSRIGAEAPPPPTPCHPHHGIFLISLWPELCLVLDLCLVCLVAANEGHCGVQSHSLQLCGLGATAFPLCVSRYSLINGNNNPHLWQVGGAG